MTASGAKFERSLEGEVAIPGDEALVFEIV
jgi:hypothetical protein